MKKNLHVWAAGALAICSVFVSLELWDARDPSRVEVIPVADGAVGPESLVFDPDGEGPYTGVSDGRILKWQGEELGWLEYATVTPPRLLKECKRWKTEELCGRPLGLHFNKMTRDLYIADAYFGLLMVSPGEKIATPIVTEVQGLPLHFTNGLDIAEDSGIVYFSDSSQRFRRREFMSTVISGDKSGRVIRYDPRNKEVQVLLSNISFPNGIVLSSDGSSLLIAQTAMCRILRYWLHPAKARVEVLIQLPGFPDNIKTSPRGGFWVGLHSKRGKLLEWLLSFPHFLREIFLQLPFDVNWILPLLNRWRKAMALRISEEGEILEVLEDFGGKMVKYISEIEERNGTLWIGSVSMPYVGVYKL